MVAAYLPAFLSMRIRFGEQQRFDSLEVKADILELSYPDLNLRAQVTGQGLENISKIILQDYFQLRKTGLSIDFYVLQYPLVKLKNGRGQSQITNCKAPSPSQHDTCAELAVMIL